MTLIAGLKLTITAEVGWRWRGVDTEADADGGERQLQLPHLCRRQRLLPVAARAQLHCEAEAQHGGGRGRLLLLDQVPLGRAVSALLTPWCPTKSFLGFAFWQKLG